MSDQSAGPPTPRPDDAENANTAAGEDLETVHDRLDRLERALLPTSHPTGETRSAASEPAWQRVTRGEQRWPVSVAIMTAIALQLVLPPELAPQPRWLVPGLEVLLLVGLIAVNPRRIDRHSPQIRRLSIGLIALISLANAVSAGRLVVGLINGSLGEDAGPLLATGAAIWLTNVIVYALWYWDLDRGGPGARAQASHANLDFLFPQMQQPDLVDSDWEPEFADYLYLSFTNATAFSPTDVMPLTRWTKMTMLSQSAISLVTIALVIARAVNILR